jgi:ubiquitin C-terminal hydrolase
MSSVLQCLSKNEDLTKYFLNQFYLLDKKQKSLLFEIIFAFVKDVDMYESLDIHRLELDENSNLKDFFQKYDKNKHILIVEIFKVNDLPFLFDLKPQNENKYLCNMCNKEITNLDQKYNCICHFSIFCSKKCSSNSDIHRRFENELKNIILREFNISNIFELDIRQILHNYTNLGRAGLDNLGNTSHMSSVLQCLSKNEDLTKYFLNQFYLLDKISISNPNSGESLTKAYYDFLNMMFNGREKPINYTEFRDIFIIKSKLLNNNEQQDSYIFLTNLFNLLHKELNRANNVNEEIKLENCKQKEGDADQEVGGGRSPRGRAGGQFPAEGRWRGRGQPRHPEGKQGRG